VARLPSFDPEELPARLAAIVDSSDDAIVSKTLDGVITSWNRGAERIFGWTAEEAVGRHITLIIPRERHPEEDDVLAQIRRGERIDHFETVRVAKDGRLVNISLTVSPVRDTSGRIVGASKVARDISERRAFEDLRSRLAAIVDSSDDAIISKTLQGVITSWNTGAQRIFGWTAEEAVGRHITLIIPRERHAEEDDVLARLRRGERIEHFETVRVAKDGRLLNVSLTVSPVRNASGVIVGASKIARDVTERRRFETQRDELLARERRAREAAEAANRAKDEFLATISHELRTPLTSILGWARLIESADLDAEGIARAARTIVRNAATQAQLVDDLLDMSRVVTGRLRLDFEACDLAAVVTAAIETVRPTAEAKGVALSTILAADSVPIIGAPDRLQQVMWNLLTNAIKFTPAGGTISVSLREADQIAEIAVCDNGDGIAPDVLPHVFEMFRQEDSSTTRSHGGLGLGLALVKHLVELHGGRVHAASPGKGQGASFSVALPRQPLNPFEPNVKEHAGP
jgi:PAS domain S-box-containing protein